MVYALVENSETYERKCIQSKDNCPTYKTQTLYNPYTGENLTILDCYNNQYNCLYYGLGYQPIQPIQPIQPGQNIPYGNCSTKAQSLCDNCTQDDCLNNCYPIKDTFYDPHDGKTIVCNVGSDPCGMKLSGADNVPKGCENCCSLEISQKRYVPPYVPPQPRPHHRPTKAPKPQPPQPPKDCSYVPCLTDKNRYSYICGNENSMNNTNNYFSTSDKSLAQQISKKFNSCLEYCPSYAKERIYSF